MNPFSDYEKTDISSVVFNQDYFRTFEENEDHLLLDMDSLVQRKDEDLLMSRIYDSSMKKCSLGEDAEEVDGTGWSSKPIEDWCQEETINWLMTAASCLGQSYGSIQQGLALPGKDLAALGRHDFVARDPVYGERLYNLLHTQAVSSQCKSASLDYFTPRHGEQSHTDERGAENFQSLCNEDEPQAIGSNNASDAESDNSIEISTKRPPGRPRLLKTKKNSTSQGKLWEFIRDLLRNRKTCPSLICWEDYSQAKFRFVRSDEVAKLWGSRKGNTKMTYEKLSRAMRYYYKRKIFLPVLGRRLVYQFGPNATGWQTDNPNFRF
ncbi:PREDICTED: ETS homologous factor-like [Ceratosolen solmsi marchali]|uniref:ETS homologous factor-like n=1 Tax=Ceratosolen solmsi marchali TaxID=326594 RepID=A0AAJ7DZB0_9HYME|nr:PREDICTED: ETS homologous factor-like [Ceratosolen solmsi marchali]